MSDDGDVFVHPSGICESDAVGAGTRVWAFAHVLPGAVVGKGCNLGDHTFVEGGARLGDGVTVKNGVAVWDAVTLEDHVFVGPNVSFTNDMTPRARVKKPPEAFVPTLVRRGATLGANATIVCGIVIDEFAFVAAGAVVTGDVARHVLVAGNPARPIGWMCECGERLDRSLRCACGRAYREDEAGGGLVAVADPSPTPPSDRSRG